MANVQLGSMSGNLKYALQFTDDITRLLRNYPVGTGRYAQLQMLESDVNSYINEMNRSMLAATVEGSALLKAYTKLANLEAKERAIASANLIARKIAKYKAEEKAIAAASLIAINKAKLEKDKRAIAAAKLIAKEKSEAARKKTAELKAKVKANEQAKKDAYEATRAKSRDAYTPRIDAEYDVLEFPKAEGGLSMPMLLGIGGVALIGAFFIFKG